MRNKLNYGRSVEYSQQGYVLISVSLLLFIISLTGINSVQSALNTTQLHQLYQQQIITETHGENRNKELIDLVLTRLNEGITLSEIGGNSGFDENSEFTQALLSCSQGLEPATMELAQWPNANENIRINLIKVTEQDDLNTELKWQIQIMYCNSVGGSAITSDQTWLQYFTIIDWQESSFAVSIKSPQRVSN